MRPLSIKQKARILLQKHTEAVDRVYSNVSEERRRILDEDRRQHPEEEPTLEKYEQVLRKSHNYFRELKKGGFWRKDQGIDVYELKLDSIQGNPTQYSYHDAFEESKVVNISQHPALLWFLQDPLRDFYFRPIKFGWTCEENLENTLCTGKATQAREGGLLFASEHAGKTLEYGRMPKILVAYDASELKHVGGPEGYEHDFIGDPRKSLISIFKIGLNPLRSRIWV